jgi:DNA-binding beta-propeller fold protein YncE
MGMTWRMSAPWSLAPDEPASMISRKTNPCPRRYRAALMRKPIITALPLFFILLGLAGWALASPNATHGVGPTTNVEVHVTEWEFASVVPDTAAAGTVIFTIHNDGVFQHTFSIFGHTTPPIPGGQTATLTVLLVQPGAYTYNSTIDDWDREMWGAFRVTGPAITPSTPATTTVRTPSASGLPLQKVADVTLRGPSSRFDYQVVDARRRRLFIAHLGAGRLIAFDLAHRRVSGTVGGLPGVRGVAVAPDLGRVYAAATDAHQVVTFDERTLRVVRRAPAGGFPDGVAYDAADALTFASDVEGREEAVFAARSGKRVGSVRLSGDPGNVQYDAKTRTMVVAVGSAGEVDVISPRTRRIVKRIHLSGCDRPHGVEVVSTLRRAFVACEGNAKLVVVDLASRRQRGLFSVGEAPDVLDFDPGRKRLYVASESGVVSVFAIRGVSVTKLGEDKLAEHAHSVAVDPQTHLVYFPLEDVDGKPVLRIMRPAS